MKKVLVAIGLLGATLFVLIQLAIHQPMPEEAKEKLQTQEVQTGGVQGHIGIRKM